MISVRFASFGLIMLLTLVTVFHVCILAGIIPLNIVWGGKLSEISQMIAFEIISIVVNLLMLFFVFIKSEIIHTNIRPGTIRIVFWIMAAVFILNTLGNLLSVSDFEKIVFTPVTLLLAVFTIRLAIAD